MKVRSYLSGRVALISGALFVVGYVTLVLFGILGSGRDIRNATPHAEEEALAAEIAVSKRCIANLRNRDPKADAAHDISRGDITPIGLTSYPHDPPTPTTFYSDACDRQYEGVYRATGKWLKPEPEGFTFNKRSSEFWQCSKATRDYVASYNRYMVERQSETIKKFCDQQRLNESGRSGEAARAVLFPNKKPQWVSGGIEEIIDGVSYITEPRWLIDQAFGSVLVMTSVKKEMAAKCSLGEQCADFVSLAYVTPVAQTFRLDRRWNKVATLNETGWRYLSLSIGGAKLTKFPLLSVQEAFKDDSCWSMRQTVIELTSTGPINRGTIYTDTGRYGANGVDQQLSGQFENVIAGKSFDIVVPQTDVRETYNLVGRRFVGPPASRLRCGVNDRRAGN